MVNKKKVFCDKPKKLHEDLLNDLNFDLTDNLSDADVLIIVGEDLNPQTYPGFEGKISPYLRVINREEDLELFNLLTDPTFNLPVIGFGRGAIALGLVNGGSLIQHIRHPLYHNITMYDGSTIIVKSEHSQCIDMSTIIGLGTKDVYLLGYADNLSPVKYNDSKNQYTGFYKSSIKNGVEAEVMYFHKNRQLGFQYSIEEISNKSLCYKFTVMAIMEMMHDALSEIVTNKVNIKECISDYFK